MQQTPDKKFNPTTVYKIAIQMLDLLEVFHSTNFMHNDIKLENIVVSINDNTKLNLIDFGLCRQYIKDGQHTVKQF
jgi:casein kinase I family protein HRR25